jgi:hypothetical protein
MPSTQDPTTNKFAEIVYQAQENNWCTQWHCTTCGSSQVRDKFQELAGDMGFGLADELAALTPRQIRELPNWQDCLRLAFRHIAMPGPQEKVLNAWQAALEGDTFFADYVLFYIVRDLPFRAAVGKQWFETCVNMALKHKARSLTESLLWVLGPKRSGTTLVCSSRSWK